MKLQPILCENGRASADWRERATNEMLRGFNDGENADALLHAIRRHRADLSMLFVQPDRAQLLRFLGRECENVRELITSIEHFDRDEESTPYVGWYAAAWRGRAIEIALAPGYGSGIAVCIGEDRAALRDFADALEAYCCRPLGRCLRYTNGWENAPDLDREIGRSAWDDIVLPPDLRARLREAVEGFAAQRDTFAAFGFPWRRGVLLVGPPGTGKTMVCRAAAAALPEMPFLYVRDLREGGEGEAIKVIFERARRVAPCILAFEDLDGFVTAQNRTVFLNEMDGLRSNEGLLVIASSNHPGQIDEALLKRPSRFDRVFHLGLPALGERRAFCERLLSRTTLAGRIAPALDRDGLVREVAERTEGFTPAYLKEAFLSAALQRAQDGATTLDERFASAVLAQVEELREHLRRTRDPEALADMDGCDRPVGFRR